MSANKELRSVSIESPATPLQIKILMCSFFKTTHKCEGGTQISQMANLSFPSLLLLFSYQFQ